MKLFDTNHRFFKPLWIRLSVVAAALGWGVFEFYAGQVVWGAIFLVFAAISFYGFFIDFNPEEDDRANR